MPSNSPIISLIMPVYNTERYLKEAIESVINQTFVQWEMICVNDGSTDNSLNILLDYEKTDSRITVIDQKNKGTAAAVRNVALNFTKGYFLHMLDSDDILSENCLLESYEKAIATNSDFVIPDMVFFEKDPKNVIKVIRGFYGHREAVINPIQAFEASLKWDISGMGLFRTQVVKKFGFDETGMNGDEYSTRLLLLNCEKITFSKGIYYYRQHVHSTTKKRSPKLFEQLTTDFKVLKLAEEYRTSEITVSMCKEKIVSSIVKFQMLLTTSKEVSIINQKQELQNLIRTHYNKIDSSFVVNSGNYFDYIIKKIICLDFTLLKIYAYSKVRFYSIFKGFLERNKIR